MRCTTRRTVRAPRAGFTLIEMMAVILIIGVLAALILPAVMTSRKSAQIAAVSGEIRQLESAISAFRNQFGIEPPSQVTLYEPGLNSANLWLQDPVSMAKIRRIWPNFDFTIDRDLNLDKSTTGQFTLYGPECLVFFLGGMPTLSYSPNSSIPTYAPIGFSKNPANPFNFNTAENRDGPYFDFKPGRFVTSTNPLSNPVAAAPVGPAQTQFIVYIDSLPSQTLPYMYASSYEGQGYQAADLNASTLAAGSHSLASVYMVGATGQPQKAKSFQIISAGFDGRDAAINAPAGYGVGGPYDPNVSNGGLSNKLDMDNITNFSSGQLVPNK